MLGECLCSQRSPNKISLRKYGNFIIWGDCNLVVDPHLDFTTRTKGCTFSISSNFYANNNKGGQFLANSLKTQRAKTRISHLVHPLTKHKLINPQNIVDIFADYYSS